MPRIKHQAIDAFIGTRLRIRRLMMGLSQEALGNELGVSFQQIQKYEKGTNCISAGRLLELALVLEVTVQYFYDGLDMPVSDETSGDDYGDGMQERPQTDPYMDFVSSVPGIRLNQAFLEIDDEDMRRQLLAMVANIARVSRSENN